MTQTSTPAVSAANQLNAFKELFTESRLEQTAVLDRDLLKWMPKADNFEGAASVNSGDGFDYHIVRYAMNQARGAQFASAQGLSGNSTAGTGKVARFALPRTRYYAVVAFNDEDILASRSNKGAYFRLKEKELEDQIMGMMMEVEKHLWGDGNGNLGQISAITNANPAVVTLADPEEIVKIEVGMRIGANTSADGTGTDRVGAEEVTAIDYDAGTFTLTSNVVADHTWAANDYLFRSFGDDVTATGDAGNVMTGIAGWIPLTAPGGSDSFFGQNRSVDVVRLAGSRQSYLGSIEETVKKLISKMARIGARPDSMWLSYANWNRLELELGARAVREEASNSPFGITSLKYASPIGMLTVMPAVFCPDDRGYVLRRDTWELKHLGGFPHIVDTDGQRERALKDADGTEVRARLFGNLCCKLPKHNGVFNIG